MNLSNQMITGDQPIPESWIEHELEIRESLASFMARKQKDQLNIDLFELPRSEIEWQIFWLDNELRCANMIFTDLHPGHEQRIEYAYKIWIAGRRYCWSDHEAAFQIMIRILNFVGLNVVSPS